MNIEFVDDLKQNESDVMIYKGPVLCQIAEAVPLHVSSKYKQHRQVFPQEINSFLNANYATLDD